MKTIALATLPMVGIGILALFVGLLFSVSYGHIVLPISMAGVDIALLALLPVSMIVAVTRRLRRR